MLELGKNKKIGRFLVGWGKWDSWGIGLNYAHYTKAITFELIHFYMYIEYWTKEEVERYKRLKETDETD